MIYAYDNWAKTSVCKVCHSHLCSKRVVVYAQLYLLSHAGAEEEHSVGAALQLLCGLPELPPQEYILLMLLLQLSRQSSDLHLLGRLLSLPLHLRDGQRRPPGTRERDTGGEIDHP